MIKKIICLGVLIVMLLSLTACQDFMLSRYKTAAEKKIETYAKDKGQDNYTSENWAVILEAVEGGKEAIEAATSKPDVDKAVITAKNEINAILTKEQEMSDFLLTISVDKTILQKNEDFYVNVTLKNQSGKGQEIGFQFGFISHIPGYSDVSDPKNPNPSVDLPEPLSIFLDNNEILSNLNYWGGSINPEGTLVANRLKSGTHEIQFHFSFSYSDKNVLIWSNKIYFIMQ